MISELEDTYDCDTEKDVQLRDSLNLLVHKKFIFPLNRSENMEYFIPAVLKSFDSKTEKLSKYASFQIQKDSLLVLFTCGSFHRLLFCQLAGYLLKNLPLGWSQPGSNNDNEQNVFSNLITFLVDSFGYVSFIDRIHFLEIQAYIPNKEINLTEYHFAYSFSNEALGSACAELNLNHNDLQFGFVCHNCSYTEEHIMIMDKSLSTAYCCKSNKRTKMLNYHLKWINKVKNAYIRIAVTLHTYVRVLLTYIYVYIYVYT